MKPALAKAEGRLKLLLGISAKPPYALRFEILLALFSVPPRLVVKGPVDLPKKQKRHGAKPRALASRNFSYFETAANKSDFIKAWNCLSSVLKCNVSFELSESTVKASIAVFSTGDAFIFL